MSTEIKTLEKRLKSFMDQLQTESGILERIVYKHKNQHRRCSYFQYLLKVRRDLKLLKSADLEEIVAASLNVINGNKPSQKVQFLESLKRNGCKFNFLERLLGATRLLSQMVEPILKAACEISKLLAQSYFMKFSLTVLAILARIRVLIQQMLLDAVHVYNAVSCVSRMKQTINLNQEGFEVFREYYPPTEELTVILDCIWQEDKYVLIEKNDNNDGKMQEKDYLEDDLLKSSNMLYEKIEAFLGVDEPVPRDDEQAPAGPSNTEENSVHNGEKQSSDGVIQEDAYENLSLKMVSGTGQADPSDTEVADIECVSRKAGSPWKSLHIKPVKFKNEKKNVAFVTVKPPAPSSTSQTSLHLKQTEKSEGSDNSFFKLLTGGHNTSLF